MSARTVLSALTAGVLLLAGCTSPEAEPTPTPSATSTPTPSPTPEPSPTPTDGIQVHSDPATGIVFEDVPDLTGDEAEVYNWMAIHQNAFWETLRTNQASATFATIASADVQRTMEKIAADNAAAGLTIGGTFRVRISDIAVSGDTATGIECNDFRDVTFATADGVFTAEDVKQDIPQRYRFELLRIDDDRWYVNKSVRDGTC